MAQDQSLLAPPTHAPAVPVDIAWDEIIATSNTVLTTHLWAAPPLRRESPIHDRAFAALRDLKADYARFLPWFSHPVLSVPALEAPTKATTSWDFAQLDPFVEDFMAAAEGRPVVANFATIPHWMFTNADHVEVSRDVDTIHWDYEQGTDFRDDTLAEVADSSSASPVGTSPAASPTNSAYGTNLGITTGSRTGRFCANPTSTAACPPRSTPACMTPSCNACARSTPT